MQTDSPSSLCVCICMCVCLYQVYKASFISRIEHKHVLARRHFGQISSMAKYLDSEPAAALSNQLISKPITTADKPTCHWHHTNLSSIKNSVVPFLLWLFAQLVILSVTFYNKVHAFHSWYGLGLGVINVAASKEMKESPQPPCHKK